MRLLLVSLLVTSLAMAPGGAGRELREAAGAGDRALLERALGLGVDVADADAAGYTALHAAARGGWLEIGIRLLDRGASPNAAAHDGTTPLMLAAGGGHGDMVRVFLLRGGRAGLMRADGLRAADLARASGYGAIARMLTALTPLAHAPEVRPHRSPPAAATSPVLPTWLPSIPPWSPDPPALMLPDEGARVSTLLRRIDASLRGDLATRQLAYRPFERWLGEPFVFLQSDPGAAHEYPSFETLEAVSAYRFEPSYRALAARIAVVVRIGTDEEGRFADFRLEGERVVVRGRPQATGEIPEIAPVLDLAIARRRYLGRTAWPRGLAVTRYGLRADRPVRILEIAPASRSRNPIRLLVLAPGGRRLTLDAGLTATNVPLVAGSRAFDDLAAMWVLAPPSAPPAGQGLRPSVPPSVEVASARSASLIPSCSGR